MMNDSSGCKYLFEQQRKHWTVLGYCCQSALPANCTKEVTDACIVLLRVDPTLYCNASCMTFCVVAGVCTILREARALQVILTVIVKVYML